MTLILDIQGFRGDADQFIFKELAAVSVNCESAYSFLFKPPSEQVTLSTKARNTNTWLSKVHHGLEYDDGLVPYEELQGILQQLLSATTTVYVKGSVKRNDLLKIVAHPDIKNIEDLGCPSIRQLHEDYCATACMWHKHKTSICASRNVKNILLWYNEYGGHQDVPQPTDECRSSCWCFCK